MKLEGKKRERLYDTISAYYAKARGQLKGIERFQWQQPRGRGWLKVRRAGVTREGHGTDLRFHSKDKESQFGV